MITGSARNLKSSHLSVLSSVLMFVCLVVGIVLGDSQAAYTLPLHKVTAIPAFARKYGLPCSACHTAWPKLNNFGMTFRDNGYQLGNDRDSPIYQNPSYFPVTFRMTPNWHLEHATNQEVDQAASGISTVTTHGFDLSGMDLWTAGTLFNNISFSLLPSSDETGAFHFENAFVRFDNLKGSSWFNFKFGKFELNNLISEKRFLFLSGNGGFYQSYHFVPPGDTNDFGLGDNQLGVELMGHSKNDYTRYSVAVLSANDGNPDFLSAFGTPTGRTYDTYLTFDQAFEVGSLGVQRIGAYAYIGERPTNYQTSGGAQLYGIENKPFYRVGFTGDLYFGKLNIQPFYMHGHDNEFLGLGVPSSTPSTSLPVGARGPSWNAGFVEFGYYQSPQLVIIGRYEAVRMQTQADPATPSNFGNIDAYAVGFRWYPIMFSRAGLALHTEYAISKSIGIAPLSGTGSASANPNDPAVWSSSLMIGFDFDF
ncbi:MAG TPA: hypothetical protein VLW83_06630 [Candidatus Acidoferrales bacterium]|nr:hypothetical protein [Candidatus Acidoferrum sp.]HUJ81541.1 hypothetical protein [Candidatus Acidoferrales bacterium]